MEPEAGEMLLILGGTALLVYYGIRAHRERQHQERRLPKDSPAYQRQVRRAFEAEWGLESGDAEGQTAEEWRAGEEDFEEDPLGRVMCPDCGRQYRAGVPFCESCGAGTVDDEDMPEPSREVERLEAPLVCVLATTDNIEAMVVRSLLESEGIPTMATGLVALNVHVFHRIEAATVRLMVLEPDADRARQILTAAR